MVGTMMLKLGEVDGMVAGAVHTTAATVRPALQILGTRPGSRLVSSVFFMCLPDEVVVYGDCASTPGPTPRTWPTLPSPARRRRGPSASSPGSR